MLPALLGALALAPLFWWGVPARWRREAVAFASWLALLVYDPRLGAGLVVFILALHGVLQAMSSKRKRWLLALPALGALLLLFLWNKTGAAAAGPLPSQPGLALLGISYLVLKAAAVLSDVATGAREPPPLLGLAAWLLFLPTYPSGPIEQLDHFRAQGPTASAERIGRGLERILFGLVKALVVSHVLGEWAATHLLAPHASTPLELWLATWAFTLRFYLDFSGYSDIAIGLAAVYGWEIQENFDRPLLRRNLVQLWQHWHMTLTGWLRVYLFVPVSGAILRRAEGRLDAVGIVVAQVVTMTFCGLWHGVSWNFALWGLVQAIGLSWVGVGAPRAAALLPSPLVSWWRSSPLAPGASVFLTFNVFALSNLLVHSSLDGALSIFARLL